MELLDVAVNIRRFRKDRQLTLAQLAERTQVTPSFLSRLENYRTIPSLPMLSKLAQALEVNLEDLVRSNGPGPDFVLTRRGEGEVVEREYPESGIIYTALAREMANKSMDPFLIEIPPHSKRAPVTTDGDEFFTVLEGASFYFFVGEQEIALSAGDSLYFRGEVPHYPDNRGSERVVLLGVYSMRRET